jgi:hypothetical protein
MDYINAADVWVHAHPYVLAAFALASAHRRLVFRYLIMSVLKTATGRRILLGNADEVLADFDDFRAELKQDLDEAKASDAAKALAAPAQVRKDAPASGA